MKHPLHHATFLLTAASAEQLPPPAAPEIAVAGRSNSGKSSAINTLANRRDLAFASKTPGRTQQINFFRLANGALLADLPGYGYAAVSRELSTHWQQFLTRYLATRQTLAGLVLTVDARRGLHDRDRQLLAAYLPSGRPALVLVTKVDKLNAAARHAARAAVEREIEGAFAPHHRRCGVIGFSATRRIGIDAAEAVIASWFDGAARVPAEPAKEKAPRSRGLTRGPKNPR